MNKTIQALIDMHPVGVITLPPDTYVIDSPVIVPRERVLDGCGSLFIVPQNGVGVVLADDGAGVQRLTIQAVDVDTGRGKFGIVSHGSLTFTEDVLVNGFDMGLLFESGMPPGLLYPATKIGQTGADNCQINRVRCWNSRIGVYVHGNDTNAGVGTSIYGQSVETLIDDNSLSGWMWNGCYHESDGVLGYRLRAAGLSTLISCGSDGSRAAFEASPGLAIGCAMRIDGPFMSVHASGMNHFQVGDPDVHQAGLLDGPMSNWSRTKGENQLFGVYPSDVIGDGNWPAGWRCIGAGPSRAPSLAMPGELAAPIRDGRRPLLSPDGIMLGHPPMQSTLYVGMGNGPPTSGTWVECDRIINNTASVRVNGKKVDYWRCEVGGSPGVWQAYTATEA